MFTRRQFGKTVGTGALALSIGEITMGVSCGSVFTDIENYVPIGLQAFDLAISLLDPVLATTLLPYINDVKGAFADVVAAINAYVNAPSSEKATLLDKITLVIQDALNAVQQFWSDANLPDGTLATTIEGILQIILSTLAAFLPLIGKVAVKKLKTFARPIPYTPSKPKNAADLKTQLNAVFTSHGYTGKVVY
jgi:hypothetical protein